MLLRSFFSSLPFHIDTIACHWYWCTRHFIIKTCHVLFSSLVSASNMHTITHIYLLWFCSFLSFFARANRASIVSLKRSVLDVLWTMCVDHIQLRFSSYFNIHTVHWFRMEVKQKKKRTNERSSEYIWPFFEEIFRISIHLCVWATCI